MEWYNWVVVFLFVASLAIAIYALYRTYNLTANDFRT